MHEVQDRPATAATPVDDAWLAAALAAKRTTPAWTALTPFAPPLALRLPNVSGPPSLTVTTPAEAKAFLADLTATRDRAYDDINAHYVRETRDPRSQTVWGAWERKVTANARVRQRYAFDVEAIENRAALAAAQAIEDTYRAVIDELRALYPSD